MLIGDMVSYEPCDRVEGRLNLPLGHLVKGQYPTIEKDTEIRLRRCNSRNNVITPNCRSLT